MTDATRDAGVVDALWRYPVKSMLGEELDDATIGERGLAGDRAYALIDDATGKVVSAKNPGSGETLFACRAAFLEAPGPDDDVPPPARISLPDGSTVRTDAADVDEQLSGVLGRAVHLAARAPDKPVIDDEQIALLSPPGTFFDAAPVHVVTTASLAALAAAYPEGRFDVRRFRPNVLLDTGGAGFVENEWVDTSLRVGDDVALHLVLSVPRCVMTTLPQGDLPHDKRILQTVARENQFDIPGLGASSCVGVYGMVSAGGRVVCGNAARLLAR